MATTFWGKYDEAAEAAAERSAAAKMPVVELKMTEASEAPVTESGSAVLARGIRGLFERKEFCDVVLVVAGERMKAHKSMLAALSSEFRQFLHQEPGAADPLKGMLSRVEAESATSAEASTTASSDTTSPAEGTIVAAPTAGAEPTTSPADTTSSAAESAPPAAAPTEAVVATSQVDSAATATACAPTLAAEIPQGKKALGPLELQVNGITTPDSLRIMLSYVYGVGTGAEWAYDPADADVNKDILRLARSFNLPHLHEYAARWLTKGLTTKNVVERLVTCEEFGLLALREKIIEQLTSNPSELTAVTSSPDIIKHPKILQDLLMQVACLAGVNLKKAAAKTEQSEKNEKLDKPEKAVKAEKNEKQQDEEEEAEEEEPEPVKKKKIETKASKVAPEPEKPAAKRQKRSAAGA